MGEGVSKLQDKPGAQPRPFVAEFRAEVDECLAVPGEDDFRNGGIVEVSDAGRPVRKEIGLLRSVEERKRRLVSCVTGKKTVLTGQNAGDKFELKSETGVLPRKRSNFPRKRRESAKDDRHITPGKRPGTRCHVVLNTALHEVVHEGGQQGATSWYLSGVKFGIAVHGRWLRESSARGGRNGAPGPAPIDVPGAACALHVPRCDSVLELRDGLVDRGTERVLHGFGENVRPRRDQVRAEAERRARLDAALDGDARLVDPKRSAKNANLSLNEIRERGGGTVVQMAEEYSHDVFFVGHILIETLRFEYYQVSQRYFHFMESSHAHEFLNYHHLRYFWTVAREGSLRRAAERLRVSQPSICTQIKLLESALGEKLFRRSGRTSQLTEFGQLVHGYAEEIFTLGDEVLRAAKQAPTSRSLRLQAGIVDSLPKLLSFDLLRPIFEHQPPIRLSCHEGKLPDLLAQLATHRLDLVLADEPAPTGPGVRVFNHLVSESGVTFCAMPDLARTMKGRFPRNLHGAPALLPTHNCNLRRELEKWFRSVGVEPRVVAEFEDGALAKIAGTEGCGFVVVPGIVASEAIERYGFAPVGSTRGVSVQFYAITAERRLTHPAIIAITDRGRASRKRRRKTAD